MKSMYVPQFGLYSLGGLIHTVIDSNTFIFHFKKLKNGFATLSNHDDKKGWIGNDGGLSEDETSPHSYGSERNHRWGLQIIHVGCKKRRNAKGKIQIDEILK
jgi:hypothetical protein